VSPALSRIITVIAAAVLAFDGVALAVLGWWSGRLIVSLIGLVFFVSSGLVLLYWRWYRRRLEDIVAAQRELGEDARGIQQLLRDQ
jgi:hypothetical protein